MGFSDDNDRVEGLISAAHAFNEDRRLLNDEGFLRDFLGEAFDLMQEEMNARNNDDYEINPEQMQHLVRAYRFFIKKVRDHNGKIDPFIYNPKEECGYLTAHFFYFALTGEDLTEFAGILEHISAIDVDATLDGRTHFSLTVPGVYRKK